MTPFAKRKVATVLGVFALAAILRDDVPRAPMYSAGDLGLSNFDDQCLDKRLMGSLLPKRDSLH